MKLSHQRFSFRDTLVPLEWSKRTFDELQKRGVAGEFTTLLNTRHELRKSELLAFEKWLQEIIPPFE